MRVIVDDSIWLQHFVSPDEHLIELLRFDSVYMHPLVFGDLSSAKLHNRAAILHLLANLRISKQATHNETLHMINERGLAGKGCNYKGMNLLASALITPDCLLWSQDTKLMVFADEFGRAFDTKPRSYA